MVLRYFSSRLFVSGLLLAFATRSHAQAISVDSDRGPVPLLLKGGLRLTHLHFAQSSKNWQFVLPLSLGAEYRVAPRFSIYTQLETDILAGHAATRRRQTPRSALSAATVAVGARYYYGQYKPTASYPTRPEFGKYLALEGAADWQQITARYLAGTKRGQTPAAVTPSLFALWGIQNRLHRHLLYDLNAGLGILAPARYYNMEYNSQATHWNVGCQLNARIFFGN